MKTFYIPTSTLNFNNILSTESISPKDFYAKREFGYSRWTAIPENPFSNVIVLYDEMCRFERPINGLEDHPLLIEVILDEESIMQGEGFYYCDHTIYLNPKTSSFIFFSEKDIITTLSMSENSLETKLLGLFHKRLILKTGIVNNYSPIIAKEPCTLNEKEIKKDFRINKMKGLLYGYYIGALLSSDKESVQYFNVLKDILNIFSAILSSSQKEPTSYQDQRLDELFEIINCNNADYLTLLGIIGNTIKTNLVANLEFVHLRGFEKKKMFLNQLQSESLEKENSAIIWIKARIEKEKRIMREKKMLLSPDDSQLVVIEGNLASIKNDNLTNETELKLFIAWVNDTLSNGTNGKISTYREVLAKEITIKAKDVLKTDWENSTIRTYLNDLRRHIAGDDFKYKWDNGLLSSISAAVLSGEDWEKMLSFMQRKEMTDYRLAYAFYGILNGFANLTRDFTDILFEQQDKNYIWSIYKEFYGQLHNKSIPDTEKSFVDNKETSEKSLEEQNKTFIGFFQKEPTSKVEIWRKEILQFAKSTIKQNKEKLLSSLERALEQNGENTDYNMFFIQLESFEGWTPTKNGHCKPWKRLQEHFYPNYKDEVRKRKNRDIKHPDYIVPSLFETKKEMDELSQSVLNEIPRTESMNSNDSIIISKTSNSFVDDKNAQRFILTRSYLSNEIKTILSKKVVSFQADYAIGGYYYEQPDCSRTNDNTIKHFINKCTYQKGKKPSWVLPTNENKLMLEHLKSDLIERYAG